MSLTQHVFPLEMMEKHEEILISALSECAGAYYDFNITQNVILGTPIQVVDNVEYSINEKIGLPPHCPYTDMVSFWGNRLSPEEQPAFFTFFDPEHLKKCYENGKSHISHTYRSKDILDNPILAEQHVILYKDCTNGDLLAVTYLKNLEPLDQLARKEKEARLQAEEANKTKTSFLFNMSHDIRTPMNSIMGFSEIIEKNCGDENCVLDAVHKVKEAGSVLLKLLDDVLNVSSIENGNAILDLAPIDLDDLTKSLQSLFDSDMKAANIDFSIEGSFQDKIVTGDVTKLLQIFINLISNSLKFTPEGGTVTVRGEQTAPETYVFSVKDTGIGMSPEFQKHVFGEFERERSITESGIKGSGLGLAIVRKLVELMGGEIDFSSKPFRGTEFIVKLHLPKADRLEEDSELQRDTNVDFSGKRVLLAEDDDLNREAACGILREMGLEVETAENGVEAVDKIADSAPGYFNLVLMDIQMPKMDGYHATSEIRRLVDTRLSSVPIVAMTANAFDKDRREALANGMNEHLGKPIDLEKLRRILVKFL